MRPVASFAFFGLAVVVAGCNLVMNLGRFSEAVTSDAGAPAVGDAGLPVSAIDAAVADAGSGPFSCLNSPNE